MVKVMRDDLHVLSGSYALDALANPSGTPSNVISSTARCATPRSAGCARPRPGWPGQHPRTAAGCGRGCWPPPTAPGSSRPPLAKRPGPAGPGTGCSPRARRAARRPGAGPAAGRRARRRGLSSWSRPRHHPGRDQAPARRRPAGSAAISRVVAAPDARTETMRTSAGGTVTVGLRDQHAAVVSAAGMRSLPSARPTSCG